MGIQLLDEEWTLCDCGGSRIILKLFLMILKHMIMTFFSRRASIGTVGKFTTACPVSGGVVRHTTLNS